ncbi:LINE-1 reverse transcriptase like protein [Dictyocoela muelleri]|nr:LINE-1 reverse transcriptase like protein [Dictyocoela muelleri]
MIPKKSNPQPADFRPISCLSNIYKLITKIFSINLYNILEINNIISFNQLGVKKNSMAAKEQLMFNHCINLVNNHKLKIIWIDIKKAYDTIQFEYLNNIVKHLNLPQNFLDLLTNIQLKTTMNLNMNNKTIGSFKPERGILQGDSLSPILFTLCMEPISRLLNEKEELLLHMNIKNEQLKINHLFYMDDLKIFANNDENLNRLTNIYSEVLETIRMEHNALKSATNSRICNDLADTVCPINGYKYLGLLEDVDSNFKKMNKENILSKIKERVKKLCMTKLNSKNLFYSINEYAISLIHYYVGILDFNSETLKNIDLDIRNILGEI